MENWHVKGSLFDDVELSGNWCQVIDAIKKFISGREDICRKLLSRFLEIRRCFAESTYFQHAEVLRVLFAVIVLMLN